MTTHSEISLQEWSTLYEAAIAFKQLRCWEWMYDSQLFGVQNPETSEIGYCCVMGNLGQVLALAVYPGSEGLDSYWYIHEQGELAEMGVPLQPEALVLSQKCLMASFEDRSELHATDFRIIRELGLKFRGKKAWPLFRNYQPGFFPWFLTAAEVRFLTTALQQAGEVALKVREDPNFLRPPEEDIEQYLVRVLQNETWENTWQQPAEYEPPHMTPLIDDIQLNQLRRANFPHQGTWITDCLPLSVVVEEGERPFYPYGFLVLNDAAMPLGLELLKPGELEREVPSRFMGLLEAGQRLPELIVVGSEQTFRLLEPIAEKLGVRIQQEEELPVLQFVLESLSGNLQ